MSDHRPSPDALLARAREEQQQQTHGTFKIFFGASPGVGKTYAMLSEARERQAAGTDVVIGVVETHGRAETEALLEGLDVLPRREIAYRGITLHEFDIDTVLARKPQLILIDELAHTNAPGSRHPKRWQDVQELLQAGIEVYTTVNVQHIESLNDVVAQITGVIVRETVPDSVIEQASDIELVDVPPDELLQRMREGKVYLPHQADQAVQNFFRKGNLLALRELALRRTADRVDAQMQDYRQNNAIEELWPTHERLLVCIGPDPLSPRLVRVARRMAGRMRAEWIVVYVELPSHARLPEAVRHQIVQTLRLAEQLGAETRTVSGTRFSDEIVAYARMRNVTKIVVGKPDRPHWKDLLFGSAVDTLVRSSGTIDIYVISGEPGEEAPTPPPFIERTSGNGAYGWAAGVVLVCTLVAATTFSFFDLTNLIMVYLLGVLFVAVKLGRGPSILASILSVCVFDFFFVRPYLTLSVSDVQYIWTLVVMLAVALVISALTTELRQRAVAANMREKRTAALYAMSRDFASVRSLEHVLRAAVRHLSETFDSQVVIMLPTAGKRLQPWGQLSGWWRNDVTEAMIYAPDASELGVAQWVYGHSEVAGLGTNTLPSAQALYLPLRASRGIVGVLGVRPAQPRTLLAPEQRHLIETFANQAGLAFERTYLADEAQQAQVQAETERLRASLLSSVSHDLRTPLATITGASSSLIEGGTALSEEVRVDLAHAINDESMRLSRLVNNLLDMTRIEARSVRVAKEWQPIEEVIGAALGRFDRQLTSHRVTVLLPPDLPLVPIDAVLIEQVFINLIENAIHYTSADSMIEIRATASAQDVTVTVSDNGPGIAPEDQERVFEKFYRASAQRAGAGLGLAICRGIVEAHGGRIWLQNQPKGGAQFAFTLPVDGPLPLPPRVEDLEQAARTTAVHTSVPRLD